MKKEINNHDHITTNVQALKKYLMCDKCGDYMKYTGLTLFSSPPQYEHKCENRKCGKIIDMRNIYPLVYFEESAEDKDLLDFAVRIRKEKLRDERSE